MDIDAELKANRAFREKFGPMLEDMLPSYQDHIAGRAEREADKDSADAAETDKPVGFDDGVTDENRDAIYAPLVAATLPAEEAEDQARLAVEAAAKKTAADADAARAKAQDELNAARSAPQGAPLASTDLQEPADKPEVTGEAAQDGGEGQQDDPNAPNVDADQAAADGTEKAAD